MQGYLVDIAHALKEVRFLGNGMWYVVVAWSNYWGLCHCIAAWFCQDHTNAHWGDAALYFQGATCWIVLGSLVTLILWIDDLAKKPPKPR